MNESTIPNRQSISTKVQAQAPEFGESTRTPTANTVANTTIKTPLNTRIRLSRRRFRNILVTLGGAR